MKKIYVVYNHGIDIDGDNYEKQIAGFEKEGDALKTVDFLESIEKDKYSNYSVYELTICDKPITSKEEYNKIEF